MWEKARVCTPSPKIGIGWSRITLFMKIPITLRYGSAMFCRSPYTLCGRNTV